MTKQEWEQRTIEKNYEQFTEVRIRNEAQGMTKMAAAIAAYETVHGKEGK